MDAVLLAKIQFGFTAGFHFLFPPTTLGLTFIILISSGSEYRLTQWHEFRYSRGRDPGILLFRRILQALRRGIIHPKLYEIAVS